MKCCCLHTRYKREPEIKKPMEKIFDKGEAAMIPNALREIGINE